MDTFCRYVCAIILMTMGNLPGATGQKIALNNQHNIQLPENAKKTYSVGAQGKNTEYTAEIKSMAFGKYAFHDLIAGNQAC